MIIHSKVFDRIERIASTQKKYDYILLYFMSDRIELIFSNTDEYTLKYLLYHFPLLVIYNKERHEEMMNINLLDDLFDTVLSRRVADSNRELILHSFSGIDYDDFIDNKDKILQKITQVLVLNKILNSFDSLNVNFLSKSNLQSVKKMTSLPSHRYMNPSKTDKSFEIYNHVAGFIKKNINKILNDNDALEDLTDFFYYPKFKKTNNKSENEDLKRDVNFFTSKEKLKLLEMLENKTILSKAEEFYNEILMEVKYLNLYNFDYDMDYATYEYLYESLYSSMKYNKITALSTNFIDKDYLEVMYEQELNSFCLEKAIKKMYSVYGFDFTSYSGEEIREYTLQKMGMSEDSLYSNSKNYSEAQMLDLYIDDYKEIIEEESEKVIQDCMDDLTFDTQIFLQKYLKSLKSGNFKHKKQ